MTDGTALGRALQQPGRRPALMDAVGGVRGLLESVVPITVFSAVYGVTRALGPSVIAALVPAVAMAIWRLVSREPLTQALSGVVAIGLGAFIATRTHRAENFFLPSIVKNLAWGAAYVVSIVARWPLVGVLLGFVLGEGTAWRGDLARRRAYTAVSWVWAAMFFGRAAIQTPLWAAGRAAALGAVNVVLGLPLFGLVVWISWLMLRRVPVSRPAPADAAPG